MIEFQNKKPNEPLNVVERSKYHVHKMSIDESDLKVDYSSLDDPIWKIQFNNPFLPNVSSKVKLTCNLEWGRHWLATEDIEPGFQNGYSM